MPGVDTDADYRRLGFAISAFVGIWDLELGIFNIYRPVITLVTLS